jgi:hypothetical protein
MKQFLFAALALAAIAIPAQAQVGTGVLRTIPSVPVSGTSEVQTLTIQASTSGGTFKIQVTGGRKTGAITWSATNATLLANVDAALELLPEIGTSGVTTAAGTLTAGIGTITLTFTGKNAKRDFPLLVVTDNAITGGTAPVIATTTPGVVATLRDEAQPGWLLVDTLTPDLYINDATTGGSTSGGPTWTKVSP